MLYIRPVSLDDLDQLLLLARDTGFGLTSLPRDEELLRRRIVHSLRSFETLGASPGGEVYLLVLEHREAARIVGTAGVCAKVGGFEPFYAYRIEVAIHESKELGVRREVPFLQLVTEHNGPSEIISLFLDPDYRRDANGRFLSLARFLFMAEHPESFEPTVIAEMRGVINPAGQSPFWDALGQHFFSIDFAQADHLSLFNKRFIADLMPRHPIYIPLLPEEAQRVIGQVHEQTRPALRILEAEGFRRTNIVDIFEAGPIVSCPLAEIRTVRQSTRAVVGHITKDPPDGPTMYVANAQREFRACRAPVAPRADGRVHIDADVANALRIEVGQAIRFIAADRTAGALAAGLTEPSAQEPRP